LKITALLGAAALMMAGCGSRGGTTKEAVKGANVERTDSAPSPEALPDTSSPAASVDSAAPAAAPAAEAAASPASAASASASGSSKAAASKGATSAPASGGSTSGGAAPAAAGSPSGALNPAPPPGSAAGAAPGAPAPAPGGGGAPAKPGGPKSQILLGSFGQESGPIGALVQPTIAAAKAWAADVNARGGLNGHPVSVSFADDGGDPNRALSIVRNFVEKDKVLAIFAEHGPVTVAAVMPYLEQKGVPRVGSVEGNAAVDTSPVSFHPTVGADKGTSWSHILPLHEMAPNVKRIYTIYCREVQNCKNFNDHITTDGFAKQLGMEVVGSSQSSLAQPSYTAEIVAAQSAGAEAVVVIMENASVARVARDAKRQGGKLIIATQQSMDTESFYKNGGDAVEGVIGGTATAAWAYSAKMKPYRDAMDRYAPGAEKGDFGAAAWASGKLMEAGAARLSDNPTPAELLVGLHALRNETLGGIVPPLTFPQGRSRVNVNHCLVVGKVVNGKFAMKDNDPDKFVCAPGWKPETP
jgi:branched-chain amino acid transport system substrate-binding protein